MTTERRRYKRFPVHLSAEVTIGDSVFEAIVGNVSEEGIGYTLTTFMRVEAEFAPRKEINLSIKIPSGDVLNLRCEIQWFLKQSEERGSLLMGMKIIDPSESYREWIQTMALRSAEPGKN